MWPKALKIVLAWIPFYALWALFVVGYSDASLGEALQGSAITIGTAAALGMGIWALTGRFPWPDRVRFGFYLLHALLASCYSVLWFLASSGVGSAIYGTPMEWRFWDWQDSGWRFLMGVWLYGLVAGISYAIRIRGRLLEQERTAAKLEGLATEARLQSLRARLNPHFLFNALNSVSALIADDPSAAERAVERLADLLRYSLAEKAAPVTLADEWRFTSDYLDMERLRLGDRLAFEADLADDALAARVPPFALQTLVENSVRHGISPKPEGGMIQIRASIEEDKLHVLVEDDGVGAASEQGTTTQGTGLENLRERLAASFGGAARLELAPLEPGGFRAALTVPVGR